MTSKIPFRIFVFVVMVILSLSMNVTAYAKAAGDPIVELFRLGGTQVGIKITFPDSISGNFMGMLAGNSLDCTTVPPNIVYCIGPYQKGAGTSTFFLIDQETKNIALQKVVSPPKPIHGEAEPQLPSAPICEELGFLPTLHSPFFSATASAFFSVLRDFSLLPSIPPGCPPAT
jgi:hypothetical protein